MINLLIYQLIRYLKRVISRSLQTKLHYFSSTLEATRGENFYFSQQCSWIFSSSKNSVTLVSNKHHTVSLSYERGNCRCRHVTPTVFAPICHCLAAWSMWFILDRFVRSKAKPPTRRGLIRGLIVPD